MNRYGSELVSHRRRGFARFGCAKFVTVMPHAAWIAERPSGPPLRLSRAFDIDFRVLLAAINPVVLLDLRPVLTHSPLCFVTGRSFPRMRPAPGTELPMSQRFDPPSPTGRNLQVNTAVLLRIGVSFTQ
jgi:hypothetical protein